MALDEHVQLWPLNSLRERERRPGHCFNHSTVLGPNPVKGIHSSMKIGLGPKSAIFSAAFGKDPIEMSRTLIPVDIKVSGCKYP